MSKPGDLLLRHSRGLNPLSACKSYSSAVTEESKKRKLTPEQVELANTTYKLRMLKFFDQERRSKALVDFIREVKSNPELWKEVQKIASTPREVLAYLEIPVALFKVKKEED